MLCYREFRCAEVNARAGGVNKDSGSSRITYGSDIAYEWGKRRSFSDCFYLCSMLAPEVVLLYEYDVYVTSLGVE